jgi:hypothetical protein
MYACDCSATVAACLPNLGLITGISVANISVYLHLHADLTRNFSRNFNEK